MLNVEGRFVYAAEHDQLRDTARRFLEREIAPNYDRWERQGVVDRSYWKASGAAGLLCPTVPEAYGGLGLDFRCNAVLNEESGYAGVMLPSMIQSDISVSYLERYASEEQKQHYLPKMVSGDVVVAIAMTEPGAGSDLQGIRTSARRDGGDFIVNGSKTFISNGQTADLVIVVAKTNPDAGAKGISLVLVEADRAGFKRGRNLDKIGLHSADTSELFFEDVRVPASNLLGAEGAGFSCLMNQLAQERLSIAIFAQGAAQRAFDEAVNYTKDRRAFGKAIFEFQHPRFSLADMKAKLQVGWAHADWALDRHIKGKLTAAEASAAKYWHTETQWEITDAALQLHGGAGYMNEVLIARMWRDARVQRIYGGTSEIMREVVSRSI
ncbi:MAG: acyl-CoA dehydrogenase family protein [Hyphomonadaceae bacterium]|nr:acyl-CoA dehydrogenase family protein [Hyphomonadaceae bacterium]